MTRLITGTGSYLPGPPVDNAALAALGLDYAYVAFRVAPQDLGRAIDGMRGLNENTALIDL